MKHLFFLSIGINWNTNTQFALLTALSFGWFMARMLSLASTEGFTPLVTARKIRSKLERKKFRLLLLGNLTEYKHKMTFLLVETIPELILRPIIGGSDFGVLKHEALEDLRVFKKELTAKNGYSEMLGKGFLYPLMEFINSSQYKVAVERISGCDDEHIEDNKLSYEALDLLTEILQKSCPKETADLKIIARNRYNELVLRSHKKDWPAGGPSIADLKALSEELIGGDDSLKESVEKDLDMMEGTSISMEDLSTEVASVLKF